MRPADGPVQADSWLRGAGPPPRHADGPQLEDCDFEELLEFNTGARSAEQPLAGVLCAPRRSEATASRVPAWALGANAAAPLQHCNVLLDPLGTEEDVLQVVGSAAVEGLALFQVRLPCTRGIDPTSALSVDGSELTVTGIGEGGQELGALRAGDAVVAVNGLHVDGVEAYHSAMSRVASDSAFVLTLQRRVDPPDLEQAERAHSDKLQDSVGEADLEAEIDESIAAPVLTQVNNLAVILHDRQRYGEAEPLLRYALRARQRLFGPEDVATLTSRSNLAVCLSALGKHTEAEAELRQAFEGFSAQLGGTHADTITCLHNLACVLERLGQAEQASVYFSRVLRWRQVTLGPAHLATLTSYNNLACAYEVLGRVADAEKLCRITLKAFGASLGTHSAEYANAANNLACLLEAQEKYIEAGKLYQRVWEHRVASLGNAHPSTAISESNLACVLHSQGKLDEAYPHYKQAFLVFYKEFGPNHPDTLGCMYNLATVLHVCGRNDMAVTLFRHELDGISKERGVLHEETLRSMRNLGKVLQAQGNLAEAEQLLQRELAGWDELRGPANEESVRSRGNLALLMQQQGKLVEAESFFRQALAGWESLLAMPPGGSEELEANRQACARDLAQLLYRQSRQQEAHKILGLQESAVACGCAPSAPGGPHMGCVPSAPGGPNMLGLITACTGAEAGVQVVRTFEVAHAEPVLRDPAKARRPQWPQEDGEYQYQDVEFEAPRSESTSSDDEDEQVIRI